MNIEVGKLYHVKKYKDLPYGFPKCGIRADFY